MSHLTGERMKVTDEIERVKAAICRYYARMWGSVSSYAVCDTTLEWNAEPVRKDLTETEAYDLARILNAIAALEALEQPTERMVQAACDATFGPAPRSPEEYHRQGISAALRSALGRDGG
jgi:hypothetical protein